MKRSFEDNSLSGVVKQQPGCVLSRENGRCRHGNGENRQLFRKVLLDSGAGK